MKKGDICIESMGGKGAPWWLRTTGVDKRTAKTIDGVYGNIRYEVNDVDDNHTGVRPALWLSIRAIKKELTGRIMRCYYFEKKIRMDYG